ncbi:CCHC-type domain-containing protein [Trichonephila clavata]|uniref:CCHC-type domain-containing protein n=1 Tax=Trichonephila clavata TaxID=2740835 RepID=A0A8X6INZ2_TRICU|nr:CCHC-type domain-containing protein [Trichonephila clavata]
MELWSEVPQFQLQKGTVVKDQEVELPIVNYEKKFLRRQVKESAQDQSQKTEPHREEKKERAPIELVDHFIDSWDAVKNATDLAEKLDHFEAIKKVHRKQNTIKAGERKQFERQPFVSNRVNQISEKSKHVNVPNKGSLRNDGFQENSQIKGDNQREWERSFERKKPIICYFCNEVGHIKPSCPRLTKNNYETVSNLIVNSWNEDYFEKFKVKFEINGVERVCLRDSGSSIDLCARSWINENDFLGEYVWIKSPLDDVCHCLPLSKIKSKTKGGEYYTKAAIKFDSSADEPYLLGNRTAELIESSEKGVQMRNVVVTRSASKEIGTNLPLANSSPIENADQIPPSEVHEEEMLETPQFDGMKEVCLAKVTSSDFRSEQEKCPDLQVLWEKARSGVDGEFQIMKGKLLSFGIRINYAALVISLNARPPAVMPVTFNIFPSVHEMDT